MSNPITNIAGTPRVAIHIPEVVDAPRSPVVPTSPRFEEPARPLKERHVAVNTAFSGLTSRITELAVFQILTTLFFLPTEEKGFGQILKNHGPDFDVAFDHYLQANANPVAYWMIRSIKPMIQYCLTAIFSNSFEQIKHFAIHELDALVTDETKKAYIVRLVKDFINISAQFSDLKKQVAQDEHTFSKAIDLQHDAFLLRLFEGDAPASTLPASKRAQNLVNNFYHDLAHVLMEAFHPRVDFGIEANMRRALVSIETKIAALSDKHSIVASFKRMFFIIYRNVITFIIENIVAPTGRFKNATLKNISHLFDGLLSFILQSSIDAFLQLFKDKRGFGLEIYQAINAAVRAESPAVEAAEVALGPQPETPITRDLGEISDQLIAFFKAAPTAESSIGSLATGLIDHVVGWGGDQVKQAVLSGYHAAFSPAKIEQTKEQLLAVLANVITGCKSGVEEVGANLPADEEYVANQEELRRETKEQTDRLGEFISGKVHALIDGYLRPAPTETVATAAAGSSSIWAWGGSMISSAMGAATRGARQVVSMASSLTTGKSPSELIGKDYATRKIVYVRDELLDPRTVKTITHVTIPIITGYIERQMTGIA